MLEQFVKSCALGEGLTLEQSVPEGLRPVGRTHIEEIHGELSPVGGTPCWNGEECEESSP